MEAGHYWPLPRGQVLRMIGVGPEVAGSYPGEGVASPPSWMSGIVGWDGSGLVLGWVVYLEVVEEV